MRLAVSTLFLFACGHSPQPVFYTLTAHDGRARDDVTGVIEVRTPHVAGYLDRNALVVGISGQRLDLARNAEWAEPLGTMLSRVLAMDLAQRLPRARVITEAAELRAQPQLRVELELRRFERKDSELLLDALVVVRTGDHELLRSVTLQDGTSGSAPELVQGMSELTAQLADRVAAMAAELAPSVTRQGVAVE